MGDPYEKVKGGRLTFKGGAIASLSKSIDKKKKKKRNKQSNNNDVHVASEEYNPEEDNDDAPAVAAAGEGSAGGVPEVYTIDAARRMKYEQLFPVEARKFAYDPKSNVKSVEDALDDRVKKKADRYCK